MHALRRRCAFLSRVVIAAFAGAATLPLLPSTATAQAGGVAVGTSAPANFTLASLDGTPVDLSKVIGKTPVVMEFWATWCPLCRKLEPAFAKAKERFGPQVTFVNIGVPDNQSAERQKAYVSERGLQGMFLFDQESRMVKAYAVPHTSYVVVLDRSGKIVYTGVGGDQDIDAAVRKALPTP